MRLGCAQGAGPAKPPAPWPATPCHSTENPPGPRQSGCRSRAPCRLAGGRQASRIRAAEPDSLPSQVPVVLPRRRTTGRTTALRSIAGHRLSGRGAKLSAPALCAAEKRSARGLRAPARTNHLTCRRLFERNERSEAKGVQRVSAAGHEREHRRAPREAGQAPGGRRKPRPASWPADARAFDQPASTSLKVGLGRITAWVLAESGW